MLKAEIFVYLKKSISDPPGIAVLNSLRSLGFNNVEKVRMGKYIVVYLNETDIEKAKQQVKLMCEKLLCNPVMEEYKFNISEE
ncbi:phosphoribosylformylglycinamidine synthase subunit PurS [Anaerocellum diazotrophicum]|uniref:Phosphoribosylformylglycinamidine synthase subunit PurS n=1 Tax=Caldicellulosiruptor diazotrophicus TaxID=2806205 RepID=A0ABN6E6S7_9FIRM|nr:phosphoribosylformylglycinamidine synthase subunit PurS [Caldicellulosiruptor diazotrophicus]BCS81108.1 phosphoribosylformylglycinamidine synthase subunit PurS [Caldicellulosiruptor diazotrophicus]